MRFLVKTHPRFSHHPRGKKTLASHTRRLCVFRRAASVARFFITEGEKETQYTHLQEEDAMTAVDNLREEIFAIDGILALMTAAPDCRVCDLTDAVHAAAIGLRVLLSRQVYRLETHYDELSAKLL